MKKVNLFWKAIISIITIALLLLAATEFTKFYNRKNGKYRSREEIGANCEGICYYNGQIKLVNTVTKKVTTPKLDWIASTNRNDTISVFAHKGKRGFINLNNGEIIIKAQFERAWIFSEGLAGVLKNNKLGFINKSGELIIPYQFPYNPIIDSKVDFVFKNGLCTAVGNNGKHGLIDKEGNWVIEPKYDYIQNPKFDFRVVIQNNLSGILDDSLQLKIPISNDRIRICKDGFIILNEYLQQLVAFDAKTVIHPFVYDEGETLHYPSKKLDNYGDDILIGSDYTAFKINGKLGILNKQGYAITQACYSSITAINNSLFYCESDGYGVTINGQGEIVN